MIHKVAWDVVGDVYAESGRREGPPRPSQGEMGRDRRWMMWRARTGWVGNGGHKLSRKDVFFRGIEREHCFVCGTASVSFQGKQYASPAMPHGASSAAAAGVQWGAVGCSGCVCRVCSRLGAALRLQTPSPPPFFLVRFSLPRPCLPPFLLPPSPSHPPSSLFSF
ncbi:hypothetical protein BC939DRAFT_120273 [Gamsiella multidivaricata]|uniref:uncharacterized protein n=1 Tax=Gamsiella multidivaricata TaxID=101098 RepID=UPI00221E3BC8|nr:uncharacterized protein BC939DRAFT_120273 [Gamsiella multidivaricata]KAI7826079.1 hypothetical protein BC939DRAFT_120273 [Gamsiella multidivaricata]